MNARSRRKRFRMPDSSLPLRCLVDAVPGLVPLLALGFWLWWTS